MWYLGCLALELVTKSLLKTSPSRPASLDAKQIADLIPARFGEQLRAVVSGALQHDPTARLHAEAVVRLLAPGDADALLAGDPGRPRAAAAACARGSGREPRPSSRHGKRAR